jgi:hypothetical protein
VNNQHNHATSVLEKFARNEEKRMIQAAADVGTASTFQVLSQIKVNISVTWTSKKTCHFLFLECLVSMFIASFL